MCDHKILGEGWFSKFLWRICFIGWEKPRIRDIPGVTKNTQIGMNKELREKVVISGEFAVNLKDPPETPKIINHFKTICETPPKNLTASSPLKKRWLCYYRSLWCKFSGAFACLLGFREGKKEEFPSSELASQWQIIILYKQQIHLPKGCFSTVNTTRARNFREPARFISLLGGFASRMIIHLLLRCLKGTYSKPWWYSIFPLLLGGASYPTPKSFLM